MRKVLLVALMAVVGALGIGAATLFANDGKIGTVDCTGVNLTFVNFHDEPGNVIDLDAFVDGVLVKHLQVTFDGSSGSTKVPLDLSGDHYVQVKGSWSTNGQEGSLDTGLVHIVCTTQTVTQTVTTPPTTVTVPGSTVPGPTVTVTTPGPTQTVTQTVTQVETQTVGFEAPPRTVTVQKTVKVPGKTVVKWRTKVVWKTKRCTCPPGTRLWMSKCHAIVHGSG